MTFIKALGITFVFMLAFFPLTVNGIWTCPIVLCLQRLQKRLTFA